MRGKGRIYDGLLRETAMAKEPNQREYVVILVTVTSEEEGLRIARSLVDSRLSACVNIISGLRSIYRWNGKIWDENEFLLLIKTRMVLFEQVEGKIKEIHSYEVPEIVAIPITRGSETYLNWLWESTLS